MKAVWIRDDKYRELKDWIKHAVGEEKSVVQDGNQSVFLSHQAPFAGTDRFVGVMTGCCVLSLSFLYFLTFSIITSITEA